MSIWKSMSSGGCPPPVVSPAASSGADALGGPDSSAAVPAGSVESVAVSSGSVPALTAPTGTASASNATHPCSTRDRNMDLPSGGQDRGRHYRPPGGRRPRLLRTFSATDPARPPVSVRIPSRGGRSAHPGIALGAGETMQRPWTHLGREHVMKRSTFRRQFVAVVALLIVTGVAVVGWVAGSRVQSPESA